MLRKCKSLDCSNMFVRFTRTVSHYFRNFYDDIDYEMINRGIFQKNAGSLFVMSPLFSCIFVTVLRLKK